MTSEASDEDEFDNGLKGAFGFEVSQFPAAQFLATRFTHKTGNEYVATGSLTIRGVTKPVTLPFTLAISGKTAHATGTAQIMRLDFNVGEGEWAGEKPVSHEVTVTVDLTATRS
jgi:polyisoprenoid-binding protein YceI